MSPNVKQAVPFFMVTNIVASLRFYVDGRLWGTSVSDPSGYRWDLFGPDTQQLGTRDA